MMKKLILLTLFGFLSSLAQSQSGNWVWLKGSNVGNAAGNYGAMGVANATNEIPARYQAAYWLDQQGNFWVFGGASGASNFNDLWRYNPTTNVWTWMKGPQAQSNLAPVYGTLGVPSPLVNPAALGYGANCWTDNAGDLWLFAGSDAINITGQDDLWRYHIATNEWTWMGGSQGLGSTATYGPKGVAGAGFKPGSRQECKSGWFYNNKLWLFGGMDDAFQPKNDIWSYDLGSNLWAWEGGGQANNSVGNFGTLNVPAPTNEPPARCSYTKWQDQDNFYIFAGADFFGSATDGRNDVWKFDKITKEWTWISGSSLADALEPPTNYCTPAVNTSPASRLENQTAQTASTCVKAFWTFGGFDFAGSKFHNDLWLFNTANLEWTKVKGQASTGAAVPSSYGTQGVASATNLPPGRGGICVWSDAQGSLYIFGGGGGASGFWEYLNDLWKFIPDTSCFNTGLVGSAQLIPPTDTVFCPGDTIAVMVPANVTLQVQPSGGYVYDSINHILLFFPGSTTQYTVMANSTIVNDPCFIGDTIQFTLYPIPPPVAAFSITPSVAPIDNPVFTTTNQSVNAVNYVWYDNANNPISTAQDITTTESTPGKYCYTLLVENQCGDKNSVTHCVEVLDDGHLVFPNVFSPNGDHLNDTFHPIIIGNMRNNTYSFSIYDRWGKELFRAKNMEDGWNGKYKGKECELGTYFYYVQTFNNMGKKLEYKGDFTLIR